MSKGAKGTKEYPNPRIPTEFLIYQRIPEETRRFQGMPKDTPKFRGMPSFEENIYGGSTTTISTRQNREYPVVRGQ